MRGALKIGGLILLLVVLAVIGFSIHNGVAADCSGVVVKDYYGMPACVGAG